MKKVLSLLIAGMFLITCGCAGEAEKHSEASVWFISNRASDFSALTGEPYDGLLDVPHLLAALMRGPTGEQNRSPIPKGTTVRSWSQEGGLLSLDLSGAYGDLTGVELTLANYCITLTLTQVEGVDAIRLTINGGSLPYGSGAPLRKEDVLFSGAEEIPVELTAALCFRRAGGGDLGVELRVFRLTESESPAMAVLEALVAGPSEESLTGLLPADMEVYSARVEDKICYADLSRAFLSEMPESREEQLLVVRSIAESLCSLGYIQGVQLLVEGETLSCYGWVDLTEPFS